MNPEVAELEAACREGDTDAQIEAVLRLEDLGATGSALVILPLLESDEPALRCTVADALATLGVEDVARVGPALVARLTDAEEIVRSSAVEALGALEFRPACEDVADLLRRDPAPLVRASAAEVLGELGDEDVLDALWTAIDNDSDDVVRAYAANSVGLVADAEALGDIDAHLSSEASPRVRAELLGASYRLGEPASLEPLLDLLRGDGEPDTTAVLNVLEDLIGRRQPDSLAADAARLDAALEAVGQDPTLRGHTERLRTRLP